MHAPTISAFRRRVLTGAVAMCAVLSPAAFAGTGAPAVVQGYRLAASPQFVTAAGTKLYLGGSPWQFTGYDAYTLPSLQVGAEYNCGGIYSLQWLDQMFSEMTTASHTLVVRTWFFQSYSQDNFVQFDDVLAAAAAHNVKIIPVLANEWGTCEGPNLQMPYKDLSWYQSGYKQAGGGYAISYRDYAIEMATRYRNNPTIAFWQLMNEAEALTTWGGGCDESAASHAIRSFADDVAGAMKAADPNHLISLGTMGGGQCGEQSTDYEYVHAGAIDLCEYHDYWSATLGGNQWNGAQADTAMCNQLNKPIFVGEAGIDASVQPNWSTPGTVTPASLQLRASLFQQKATAEFGIGAQGFLIWNKSLGASSSYDVGPGDPTEGMMAALQDQITAAEHRLPEGQIIVDGDPGPGSSAPAAPSGVAAAPEPAGSAPSQSAGPSSSSPRTSRSAPAPPARGQRASATATSVRPLTNWLRGHLR